MSGFFQFSNLTCLCTFFLLLFLYIFIIYLLLFNYSCPAFFPHCHALPHHSPQLLQSILPIVCAQESSIQCSFACPFPLFPPLSPFPSVLLTVSLFFLSKSLVLISYCVFLLLLLIRFQL